MTRSGPDAGSRARNPQGSGHGGEHRTLSSIPSSPTSACSPRLHYAGYDAWLDHIWPAAACTRPIRLRGDIKHIDAATGELLRTIPTIGMPDWSIYKACGNRRATTCPGCAETYRRDAYHLLRAGLVGGKGVTPDVAGHPAVFVTFTAPSFGPVHSRPVRQHTCARQDALHAASRNPATPAATRPPASTAARPHASPGTSATMPGSASRCARTATTTPLTSSGTTRQANSGGAPSKPSNATSASSAAAVEYRRSGFPAATANTA